MGGRIQVAPREERTRDGIVIDSKHEMQQYTYLRALERSATIRGLRTQVKYPLCAVDERGEKKQVSSYIADFVCEDRDGKTVVYDAKGHRTEMYKLKRKWFEWQYAPLRIVEL